MPDDFLIQSDFPLGPHNTLGIAAQAHRYVKITSAQMLREACEMSELVGLPRFVLGGGSNIVLRDDYPGVVLHICIKGKSLLHEDDLAFYVKAGAGENWHGFVLWTLEQGWGGLENLSLIPGSVGAAPIQNVGAYGVEVKDRLLALTAFDLDSGEIFTLTNAECEFGYRDSVFKHRLRERAVVLDVTFALPKTWRPNMAYADVKRELQERSIATPTAREISDAVIAIRSHKLPDPARIGNAGSFFKNPIVSAAQRDQLLAQFPQLVSYPQADGSCKLAAGWLIEQCGWKGKALGAAGVYEKQALVLVNRGGARGKDILALAQAIQLDVSARFGVRLEMEPVLI